ncbi:hypothetical protein PANT_1d00038 [Moesziomyces antarcticus T-34]|uniref:Bola-like protein n=1 Tax=Pseudozyma antarctica (strain T-34) TaxID=1151754 RepID=M9LIW6_PSEA3|nr:hypothetical protein PANT_1d00038 [Moesziomyces antarcticus T-34]
MASAAHDLSVLRPSLAPAPPSSLPLAPISSTAFFAARMASMGSLLRTTARVPFSRTFSSTSLRLNTAAASATDGEQMIRTILTDRFQPSVLKVQDVSGEWPPVPSSRPESCSEYADAKRGAHIGGCGSFYAIQLSSKKFNGLSTVKAHRLVNEQLKDVIKDIHGLQLRTMPEE